MEYEKNFDDWNRKKVRIHNNSESPYFYEGEVWWCSIGVNIGTEQDGKNELYGRPVLVIAKINDSTAWILPLSSKLLQNRYRLKLSSLKSQILLSQIRTVSAKRFFRRITVISEKELNLVITSFIAILEHKKRNPAC